jgi:hypothetical protein
MGSASRKRRILADEPRNGGRPRHPRQRHAEGARRAPRRRRDGITSGRDGITSGRDGITSGRDGITSGRDGALERFPLSLLHYKSWRPSQQRYHESVLYIMFVTVGLKGWLKRPGSHNHDVKLDALVVTLLISVSM